MVKRLLVVVAALLALSSFASAQYTLTLQNDALTGSGYEFEVWIASTSGTIVITSYQIVLSYNTAIAGTGTLGFSYIAGTTALNNAPAGGVGISAHDGDVGATVIPHLVAASSIGSDNVTTTAVRVGRFRITNTVAFPILHASIGWVVSPTASVIGGTLVNINNVSTSGNHTNTLTDAPLPITLASFTVAPSQNSAGVRLSWMTVSETNNFGFYVQRRVAADQVFADVPNSFIPGHGTTLAEQQYSYVDNPPKSSSLEYRIRQVDLDGQIHLSESVSGGAAAVAVAAAPAVFALSQNYPNPFNPATEIQFTVATTGHTTLKIYNMIGQVVSTLFDGIAETGKYYRMTLNGSQLASGVYFYRLQGVNKSDLKKMVLLK